MKLELIVPCYNEEKTIPFFIEEVMKVKDQLSCELSILFVDDGSGDHTLQVIKQFYKQDEQIQYLSFSRNFGKEAAIFAGLQHTGGDLVCIMDVDLQDPPALLPQMVSGIVEEGYDSVATRRVNRLGEPQIRSFFARQFYRLMSHISKTEIVDGARDYRMMNRKFVDALLSMQEYHRFSKGLFGWVGFRTKWLAYENIQRVAGETKWSFWKLFKYSIDGIVGFSTVPLAISSVIGLFFTALSFLFLVIIVIRKLLFDDPVNGWASTISVILFLGGLQLFSIGVLGQYLAKTYMEVKKRPIYILKEDSKKSLDSKA